MVVATKLNSKFLKNVTAILIKSLWGRAQFGTRTGNQEGILWALRFLHMTPGHQLKVMPSIWPTTRCRSPKSRRTPPRSHGNASHSAWTQRPGQDGLMIPYMGQNGEIFWWILIPSYFARKKSNDPYISWGAHCWPSTLGSWEMKNIIIVDSKLVNVQQNPFKLLSSLLWARSI